MIGPFRGGRTKAATGVPGQPNVFYIGACNGGVWKSTDYGRVWTPIFDDQPTGSIGAIAVAPSNPDIVYVGSGEGLQRPDLSTGDGIYKSTDAGRTWQHLGLRDGQQIPADRRRSPQPQTACGSRCSATRTARTRSAASSDRPTAARRSRRSSTRDENTGGIDVVVDPAERGRRLRGALGAQAGAVGERRVHGPGQRPLQVDRRRHDLAPADGRAARRSPRTTWGASASGSRPAGRGESSSRSRPERTRGSTDRTTPARPGRSSMTTRTSPSAETTSPRSRSIRRTPTSSTRRAW